MKMKLLHIPYYLFILLSSTTTSIAALDYAKPDCSDMCGSVRIPFPFGIGANCSVNKWYTVDCNSSKPYLSALNNLKILGFNLEDQTVTINMPIISAIDCSNSSQSMSSINLDNSPFLFSESFSEFIFVGCGNVVIMDQESSVLTGCSTNCHNDTVNDKNNCLGITCCQTTIPHNLKSYTMNLTLLERLDKDDGGCGSAFLVDKNYSYGEGTFSGHSNSFVPVSLLWTLSDLDYFNQVRCCARGYKSYFNPIHVDNGTVVLYTTWKCDFPYSYYEDTISIEGNPYLKTGCSSDDISPPPVPKYAKTGCNSMCGSVMIPYPFGIGANCAINDQYIVVCNFSKPYLSALHHLELLSVDLGNQTVTVNTRTISDCSSMSETISINLGSSPFLFSKSQNLFVFKGCGNAFLMDHVGITLTGCSTDCRNDTVSEKNNNCIGITCCQTTIPRSLKSYTMNLTRLDRQGRDGVCGSAFLVDKNSHDEGRFYDSNSFIPTSLLWTLSNSDYDQETCLEGYKDIIEVNLGNGTVVDSWRCNDQISCGNPYLRDGCGDM